MFPSESIRRSCRFVDQDWPFLVVGGAVAQLAAAVVSPGVEAAIGSDGSGVKVVQADLAEADASWLGWGEGGLGASGCGSLGGADGPPLAVCAGPSGGGGDVAGDGLAEVVSDVALEPAVEQVPAPGRVGTGPAGLASLEDGLLADAAAAGWVEADRPGLGGLGLRLAAGCAAGSVGQGRG